MPENNHGATAKPAIEIDLQKLFDALERGIDEMPSQEINLRTRIWWAGNHIKRGLERSTTNLHRIVRGFGDVEDPNTREPWPAIPETIRIENMKALLPLLESQPNEIRHVVPEAELLRELGRFDEAIVRAEQGATLVEINPSETKLTSRADFSVRASASEFFPFICEEIHAMKLRDQVVR